MAFNTQTEDRLDQAIKVFPADIREKIEKKKMFGGLAFLYKGKMTVGVVKDDLMVRVVGEKMEKVLAEPYVRPMDFNNKPMKEFIFVAPEGYQNEARLHHWLELGLEHAQRKTES